MKVRCRNCNNEVELEEGKEKFCMHCGKILVYEMDLNKAKKEAEIRRSKEEIKYDEIVSYFDKYEKRHHTTYDKVCKRKIFIFFLIERIYTIVTLLMAVPYIYIFTNFDCGTDQKYFIGFLAFINLIFFGSFFLVRRSRLKEIKKYTEYSIGQIEGSFLNVIDRDDRGRKIYERSIKYCYLKDNRICYDDKPKKGWLRKGKKIFVAYNDGRSLILTRKMMADGYRILWISGLIFYIFSAQYLIKIIFK